mgnify:CR=1 FL=1
MQLILNSGWIGVGIGLLFLIALTFIIERFLVYYRETTSSEDLRDRITEAVDNRQYDEASQICHSSRAALGKLYLVGIENHQKGPAALRNILFREIDLIIMPPLKQRLGFISTIGKAAPMLGLMGTVLGMIGAFSNIAGAQGQGVDPKDLAGDIGMALGTTFLGLFVALPVLFATTYLRAKVEKFQLDLDWHAQYCIDMLYHK